jgi:hypothetical protein
LRNERAAEANARHERPAPASHGGEEQRDALAEHRDGAATTVKRASMRGAVDPRRESGNDHDVRRGARTCDLARHTLAVTGHASRSDDGHGPCGEPSRRRRSRAGQVDAQGFAGAADSPRPRA